MSVVGALNSEIIFCTQSFFSLPERATAYVFCMCSSSYHLAPLGHYRAVVKDEIAGPDGAADVRGNNQVAFTDVHVASSCLQKALRRGEGDVAFAAGCYLLRYDEARLWRRLVVCVFEDFGLCDLSVTAKVVAVVGSRSLRLVLGQERVLAWLIAKLCALPKDRRLDDLYALGTGLQARRAGDVYSFGRSGLGGGVPDDVPGGINGGLIRRTARLIAHCERPVPRRSFRSLSVEACELALTQMAQEELCDRGLFELCLAGARLSRCLLPVLVPLAIDATDLSGGLGDAAAQALPAAPLLRGVPAYAFDGFTRVGRAILADLAKREALLQPVLAGLAAFARIDVLHHLLFFAEGARCVCLRSDRLSQGLHTDAVALGVRLPQPDADEAVGLMQSLLPRIHALRGASPLSQHQQEDLS